MALFMQFTGNVVDANDTPVTTYRYRGYHKETKVWSKWYSSNGESQYNLNLGDASWLTQTGSTSLGDTILLMVESLETNPAERSFAMIVLTLNKRTTYINNIQLKGCTTPKVKGLWSLVSITDKGVTIRDSANPIRTIYVGRVGEVVTVDQSFTDEYNWTYDGLTHYHNAKYLTEDIFSDRVGLASVYYDWGTSIFTLSDNYVFPYISNKATNGYYTIKVKVTNKAGLIVTDLLYIQIRNNKPILDFTWFPELPSIADDFNITATINDSNNCLSKVTYYFDNNEVVSNVLKTYTWPQTLGVSYVNEHTIKGIVLWNDGFATQMYEHVESLGMSNILPTFSISKIGSPLGSEYIRLMCLNLQDLDGDVTKVRLKWSLSFLTPLDNLYKEIYYTDFPTYPNERYIDIPLINPGTYKVVGYAIDIANGINSVESEFTIEAGTAMYGGSDVISTEWE